MKYNSEQHHRHSIRLKGYDYSTAGAYFVTVCAKNHGHHFGKIIDDKIELSEVGKIVNQFWIEIPNRFNDVMLDAYTIMPNHLHGIIVIVGAGLVALPNNKGAASSAPTLGDMMRAFKSISAIKVNRFLGRTGQPLWQRNYYEHIIRNEKELNIIREYIINNPLQWQFDRENPEHVKDKAYDNQWCHFEEELYGKTK